MSLRSGTHFRAFIPLNPVVLNEPIINQAYNMENDHPENVIPEGVNDNGNGEPAGVPENENGGHENNDGDDEVELGQNNAEPVQEVRERTRAIYVNTKPDSFAGLALDNGRSFLEKFIAYCEVNEINDDIKKAHFRLCLTGPTELWFSMLEEANKETWALLEKSFRSNYIQLKNKWGLEQDFNEKKQKGDESVEAYINTILRLAHKLNKPESEVRSAIIRGLKPNLKIHVISKGVEENLTDTISQCKLAEVVESIREQEVKPQVPVIKATNPDSLKISSASDTSVMAAELRQLSYQVQSLQIMAMGNTGVNPSNQFNKMVPNGQGMNQNFGYMPNHNKTQNFQNGQANSGDHMRDQNFWGAAPFQQPQQFAPQQFAPQPFVNRGPVGVNSPPPTKDTRFCNYCKKTGHMIEQCYARQKRENKPNNATKNGQTEGCFICGATSHWKRDCPQKSNQGNGRGPLNN
jgi:hypothetical protein